MVDCPCYGDGQEEYYNGYYGADGEEYYYGEDGEPPTDLKKLKLPKFPWRINMLAVAKHVTPKYQPPEDDLWWFSVKNVEIDPEALYWNDHLARPAIRCLTHEKKIFSPLLGESFTKKMNTIIGNTWQSMYNHYKNQWRLKRIKKIKDKRYKKGKKLSKQEREAIRTKRLDHIKNLACPKKRFLPPPRAKEVYRIGLEEMLTDIAELAQPKKRDILSPRPVPNPVPRPALEYIITEAILKLTQQLARFRTPPPPPLIPGHVKRAALHAKPSALIEKLAVPMLRTAKKDVDEKEDPWKISPNALKYKASQRIIELAKPLERD